MHVTIFLGRVCSGRGRGKWVEFAAGGVSVWRFYLDLEFTGRLRCFEGRSGRGFRVGFDLLRGRRVLSMSQGQEKAASTASTSGAAEAAFVPEVASASEAAAGWQRPPSRIQTILWSGSKRHVFIGMLGISVLATIPWVLLTSGTKHDSHADYMDRAEEARRARLSTSSKAVASPTSS